MDKRDPKKNPKHTANTQKEAYTVTNADKKANTKAYQDMKAGKKNVKTGEPMYKAADHMKEEDLRNIANINVKSGDYKNERSLITQIIGEEGYDVARDMGKVKPSKDKKDATTMPVSDEIKKTQKVNKGPSALELIKKKYGKSIMDVKK